MKKIIKTTDNEYSMKLHIPNNYTPVLNLRQTEEAIKIIKDRFQEKLVTSLNLTRVSAPLIVLTDSGINDYLGGTEAERPVIFNIINLNKTGEIVQSLAKWKRNALSDYQFKHGEGLYTDMNAIRPHEKFDNIHSIYVDQWDWERIIEPSERNISFLKTIVTNIYSAIKETEIEICRMYPMLSKPYLPKEINFIHSEELLERYPNNNPRERENLICQEKGAVFIIGIGGTLKNGEKHDDRASDYDDWSTLNEDGFSGLNGDILVWYPVLEYAFELSSMGIRVDKETLLKQLKIKNEMYKVDWEYHQKLIHRKIPLTIGGGIGQSRLCMLFLRKAHIGEVQASIWPQELRTQCSENKIFLL